LTFFSGQTRIGLAQAKASDGTPIGEPVVDANWGSEIYDGEEEADDNDSENNDRFANEQF
jgi:hypothetical protein